MTGLLNARVCHDVVGKKYNKIVYNLYYVIRPIWNACREWNLPLYLLFVLEKNYFFISCTIYFVQYNILFMLLEYRH